MAKENKTENTDDITMEVMPGADPVPEEEAGKDFKVDMNFEEEVEFPKEEEVEEVEELEAEEEPSEGTEEVAEEEEAEAVVEEAESGGEETVLEADGGDTQEPEGDVPPATVETNETKEPMIPKSRFDEVLAKQKALAKKLEEATNPIEKIENAPEYNFDEKEAEYQSLVLNGKTEDAAKLRGEIRDAERQSMMFEVQNRMGKTVQESTEVVALQQKAAELAAKFPVLDETHADFDETKTQEVLDLRDAFMIQGFTGVDALDKATKYVMGESEPAPKEDAVGKKIVEKKKVANTQKKIEAAEKQPPAMKGKNKTEKKIDISKMSVDEFDALPPETLRRMRGDFG